MNSVFLAGLGWAVSHDLTGCLCAECASTPHGAPDTWTQTRSYCMLGTVVFSQCFTNVFALIDT